MAFVSRSFGLVFRVSSNNKLLGSDTFSLCFYLMPTTNRGSSQMPLTYLLTRLGPPLLEVETKSQQIRSSSR